MAEYEEKPLHQSQKNDSLLNGAESVGILSGYFFTRFGAARIGGSAAFIGFEDPVAFARQLADFEQKFTKAGASLLLCPIEDTYFRRVDEELVASIEAKGKMPELMPLD